MLLTTTTKEALENTNHHYRQELLQEQKRVAHLCVCVSFTQSQIISYHASVT